MDLLLLFLLPGCSMALPVCGWAVVVRVAAWKGTPASFAQYDDGVVLAPI
jgi:hypothetical protein